ncbi:MAG: hypothetical protein JW955_04420 [Sedimentisphaerales bacterium]|nr:hypothetical protein [Sedimentisphaerales bacterium]
MVTRKTQRIMAVMLTALLLAATSAIANLGGVLDQTINKVAQEAAGKLNETDFQDITNIAILPLWGDCNPQTKAYIGSMIQSQIIGGRYKVIERDAQTWDSLLGEIEWNVLREDIMNAETVQKFGKVIGCDAIVFGTIRECAEYPDRRLAITRLTLKMSVVQTGEARWSSGEIRSAQGLGVEPPLPPADPALLRVIARLADSAVAGMKGVTINAARIGLFPLLGQAQSAYVTEVLQAELTKAGWNPSPISRVEWEEYLVANYRSVPTVEAMTDFANRRGYDAFLYGTVSECRILGRKYKAMAAATLNLVNAKTGEVIWNPGEIREEGWLDLRDILVLASGDPLVWVLGGIVVLLIAWRAFAKLFRSATRPR